MEIQKVIDQITKEINNYRQIEIELKKGKVETFVDVKIINKIISLLENVKNG